jgi:hypothetical protein
MPYQTATHRVKNGRKTIANCLCAVMLALVLVADQGASEARAATGPRCYVNASAVGSNDGDSWAGAYTELYSATSNGLCTEIWVAQGVYTPDPSARSNSFYMIAGDRLYGGFAGGETSTGQRNWAAHVTILSGDIDNNDAHGGDFINESYANTVGSNSYHVIVISGAAPNPALGTTVVDGFTITGGDASADGSGYAGGGIFCQANGTGSECSPTLANLTIAGNRSLNGSGGGMYNAAMNTGVSNPQLQNVMFIGNHAQWGGAMYNNGMSGTSSPSLTDVSFTGNNALWYAGAIFNDGYTGASSPTLRRVTFSGNSAGLAGGAMLNNAGEGVSSPTLANVTFSGNSTDGSGGAMRSASTTGTSNPVLRNVTFHGNSAAYGGALNNLGSTGSTHLSLENVILWGDTATVSENEIFNDGGTATIQYSVVQGGCWAISGVTCGSGNWITDPLLGALANNGGFTQTMALLAGSSALDTGLDEICAADPVGGLDQRGVNRPRGLHCDIGAFEEIPPASCFDGDRISEPAKFVPATGTLMWLEPGSGVWTSAYLGMDVSSYVPRSDFDGDTITDPSKFVQPSGALWYLKSSDGQWGSLYVGSDYSTSAAGSDFDGDIKTDPAKYLQPAGSVWYYESGTAAWQGIYIGSDAAPYLAGSDYDGDGQTDMAKYVPSAGAIWYRSSGTGTWEGKYIGSDGTPITGSDFDGDGRTDLAKYVASANALWYFASSTASWNSAYMGPGPFSYVTASDFDGDGKTDPAKYVPGANALWYLESTTGLWEGVYMGGDTYEVVN